MAFEEQAGTDFEAATLKVDCSYMLYDAVPYNTKIEEERYDTIFEESPYNTEIKEVF